MPWEEWRDVAPKRAGLRRILAAGPPSRQTGPRIETSRAIRSRGPPWKKGVHSGPRQLLLVSSLSLSLFKISPPLSLAREIFPSLSPLWRSVFFAAFASRPAVHSILSRRKRVSSGLQPRPANNREHVISYSAYHTHYPSIFCPTARLTRWNLLREKCQFGRHPARTTAPDRDR